MRARRKTPDAVPAPGSKGVKTGSNVRHKSLAAARRKEIANGVRLLERAAEAYRRACRRLISKADFRTAAAIMSRVMHEMHRSNLQRGNRGNAWTEGREEARRKIEREFARTLRGYRRWRKLAREYRVERERLVKAILARRPEPRLHVDLAEVLPPDSGETRAFYPPFTVFDVDREDSSAIVDDRSVVVAGIGHVINNVDFRQEDDGPIATDFYGINWPARLFSSASCGVNFTTPKEGRLKIGAALRCFHSRIGCALRDQFGFSEADVKIEVRLIISVVEPSRSVMLRRTILTDGLTSFGKDLAHTLPELDSASVHAIEATTEETFPAEVGVQLLAGCEVFVLSEVDDMRAYVNALLWWRLEKLTVEVV